jgi:hypothetical protein
MAKRKKRAELYSLMTFSDATTPPPIQPILSKSEFGFDYKNEKNLNGYINYAIITNM